MTGHHREVKPAQLLRAGDWQFEYRQKCTPATSNLELLTYGTYRVAGGMSSDELYHRGEETILFCLSGEQGVQLEEGTFRLKHYDTLYVPLATPYRITSESEEEGLLAVCRAPATKRHAPFHGVWEQVRTDERRIRHLDGKDVFLMLDVSEQADRLLAGYTIYRPHTRVSDDTGSFPAINFRNECCAGTGS